MCTSCTQYTHKYTNIDIHTYSNKYTRTCTNKDIQTHKHKERHLQTKTLTRTSAQTNSLLPKETQIYSNKYNGILLAQTKTPTHKYINKDAHTYTDKDTHTYTKRHTNTYTNKYRKTRSGISTNIYKYPTHKMSEHCVS